MLGGKAISKAESTRKGGRQKALQLLREREKRNQTSRAVPSIQNLESERGDQCWGWSIRSSPFGENDGLTLATVLLQMEDCRRTTLRSKGKRQIIRGGE